MPTKESAILKEFYSIRDEILQLNSQMFTAVTVFLGVDMTIIGWMFSKDDPSEYLFLPTLGVLILFSGGILLLVRNRLAHKLAIFQRWFIETRLSDIYWARAYFKYKEEEQNLPKYLRYFENLAESSMLVIWVAQLVNILVFLIYALYPLFAFAEVALDWLKVSFFVFIVIILMLQYRLSKHLTRYEKIDAIMKETATKLGCVCDNKNQPNG